MNSININTADKHSLIEVPGIGEKIAKAILQYRNEKGEFTSLDELKKVKGITEHLYNQCSPFLSIEFTKNEYSFTDSIQVFGTPDSLIANLPISGDINKKRKLEFHFEDTPLLNRHGVPLAKIFRKKRIYPDHTQRLRIRIPLAPSTPPGIYEMKIVSDESSYKATVEVVEKVAAFIHPGSISIIAAPNETVEKVIYVTNRGNIPLRMDEMGALVLEGQNIECNTIRGIVRNFDTAKDLFGIMELASQELNKLYEEAGVLRYHTVGGPQIIHPGESMRLILAFSIPGKIRNSSQYFTRFRFYNTALNITIIPSKSS